MSGVEVLGTIGAVIGIIDACVKIYDGAAKDLKLSETFRVVARQLPILSATLTTCKTYLDAKKTSITADVWTALEETLDSCEEKARNLRTIFEKVITVETDGWHKRYMKAMHKLGKGTMVEELMTAITKDVQLVVNHRAVQSAETEQRQQLDQILEEVQKLEPSMEEDRETGTNVTNWYGKQNVIVGDGQQFIYETMSGTQNFNLGPNPKLPSLPEFSGVYAHSGISPVAIYVSRLELERKLIEQLAPHTNIDRFNDHVEARTVVLWGLGGAGKSQLVLRYTQQQRKNYHRIFWLAAAQRQTIERDYLAIYRLLFPETIYNHATVSVEDAITTVKGRLQNFKGRSLWVMDSADMVEDENDPGYIDLHYYLPDIPGVDRIITTRSSTLQDLSSAEGGIEVGEMTEEEAVALFQKHARLQQNSEHAKQEILAIVLELGCLALAVTLAGSYVKETPRLRSDITMYLPEYRAHRKRLLSHSPRSVVHRYSASVLNTWEMSLTAVERQSAFAARLLNLLAFLHFDDILAGLFQLDRLNQLTVLKEVGHTRWIDLLSLDSQVDKFVLEKGFSILRAYSLLSWRAKEEVHCMHKLVHAWCQERLPELTDRQCWSLAALDLLGECAVLYHDDLTINTRLAPHIMANFTALKDFCGMTYRTTGLDRNALQRTASLLQRLGLWSDEHAVRAFLLQANLLVLGPKHSQTLISMNHLAYALSNQGQYEEAERLLQQTLELSKTILGEEALCTLTSESILTDVLRGRGQHKQAEQQARRALRLIEGVLGEQHSKSMNNLAVILTERGRFSEAEALYWQIMQLEKTAQGEWSLDVVTIMSNLAHTISKQGRYKEAEELHQQALTQFKVLLGDGHPYTWRSMTNLAETFSQQGRYGEAERLYRQILELEGRSFGEQHPSTVKNVYNLAQIVGKQGRYEEAEKLLRGACESSKIVLGEQHPSTLIQTSGLAEILRMRGKYVEAEELHRLNIGISTTTVGEQHETTLSSIHGLALTLNQQGRYKEAEELHRQSLDIQKVTLGEQHPSTLVSMSSLADTLGEQKQYVAAEDLFERTLKLQISVLGKQHPDTLTSMNNFSLVLYQLRRYDMAANLLQEVVKVRQAVIGERHPNTLMSMGNLADVLIQQDRYSEAETLLRKAFEMSKITLGDQHAVTIEKMNSLANALEKQAQYKEAEELYREVLKSWREILGEQHHRALMAMDNLANVISQQRQHQAAESLRREALDLYRKLRGEQDPQTLTAMNNLAVVLYRQAKYSEAEGLLKIVIQIRKVSIGEEHPDTMTNMHNLASALNGQGRYAEAEALCRHTLKLRKIVLGEEHLQTASSMAKLKEVLEAQGKHEEVNSMSSRSRGGAGSE